MSKNKHNCKVAVVLPVFNTEKYLEQCLLSLLNQTISNFEVFAVDDGSTDGSCEVLEKIAKTDSRIHVYHKKNGGVSSARNFALEEIEGKGCFDIVCFIDSDDMVSTRYLHLIVDGLQGTSNDLVMLGFKKFDRSNAPILGQFPRIRLKNSEIVLKGKDAFRFAFGVDSYGLSTSNLISFGVCNFGFSLEAIRGERFNEGLKTAEDLEYLVRIFQKGVSLCVKNEVTCFYRIRRSSLTHDSTVRIDDVKVFLKLLQSECAQSLVCREVIEYMAFKHFWQVTRAACDCNLLDDLYLELSKMLRYMGESFRTPILTVRGAKKRILIFKLGPSVLKLYFNFFGIRRRSKTKKIIYFE